MITDILINLGILFQNLFLKILPNWEINESFVDGFLYIARMLLSLNMFFPFDVLFLIIAFITMFELTILTINFTFGIIGIIRGSGSMKI